jgi:hypothetical protein
MNSWRIWLSYHEPPAPPGHEAMWRRRFPVTVEAPDLKTAFGLAVRTARESFAPDKYAVTVLGFEDRGPLPAPAPEAAAGDPAAPEAAAGDPAAPGAAAGDPAAPGAAAGDPAAPGAPRLQAPQPSPVSFDPRSFSVTMGQPSPQS